MVSLKDQGVSEQFSVTSTFGIVLKNCRLHKLLWNGSQYVVCITEGANKNVSLYQHCTYATAVDTRPLLSQKI